VKIKKFCIYCGEKLKEKFIDDKRRFFCGSCNEIVYENPIPATASVIINNNKILLVKRKLDPKKGQWCLPGGFIELNETPENACLRELKEETGLNGKIDYLIDAQYSSSSLYNSVIVIGYLVKDIKGNIIAGDDAEEAAYFDIEKLPNLAFESHKLIVDKILNS
jgi:ADP-ribose pyrophosphatase YjhB (NUDIX family)